MGSSNNKVVLFVTDRIFWPADDGHKVVLSNYCKGLADEYSCDIHVLTFLEPGQSQSNLSNPPNYIATAELMPRPSKLCMAVNLLSAVFRGAKSEPLQCALFKSSEAKKKLQEVVKRLRPSHIFFDLPRLSSFLSCTQDYPCKKVLYMEDLFSERYARQLEGLNELKKTGGVAGKYTASFKGSIANLASVKAVQRIVLRMESKRMSHLELSSPNMFDYVVLVSPNEAEKLVHETNAENIFAIPVGVDCSYYMAGPRPEPRQRVLSYLGDMRTSANADSLRYIAKEVLPLIEETVVLEVSGFAPDELRNEFIGNNQVRFLGRVEDTRETLRSSSVFLAPIAYGTGIKTKILEAMAIGVPIVTNSVGNEGIGLIDGVEALIDDDADELANDVATILASEITAERLRLSAQAKARKLFDWSISLRAFSNLGLIMEKSCSGDEPCFEY